MERRLVRVAQNAFLLTMLMCGTTCWLLYGLGCCVLTPATTYEGEAVNASLWAAGLYPPKDWSGAAAAAEDLSGDEDDFTSTVRLGPRQAKLRRDEIYILDKSSRRRHRVEHSALGVQSDPEWNGGADEAAAAATPRPTSRTTMFGYRKGNITAVRRLPQALIIGVKKGGTRALLEFIRLHPDVRAVGPETHFFDRHYDRGLEWYRRQMPPTLDSQLTMEKTPSYFITKEVPVRIYNMSREVKLLVVVRDPVTRAISDYAQTASKRPDMKYFEDLAFLNNATGLVDTTWGAIKIGVYAKHLERWLQYFPLEQFHFVSGELLIKDPAGEMAKVQDFLGLRRVITENHFYFNETKGFPCLKKSEGNGSPRCLGKTKGRVHPSIDPATIQRLRDFYRPFNLKFYQMTNIDFGWP